MNNSASLSVLLYSNTTNVKVKLRKILLLPLLIMNSNTTNVKVKQISKTIIRYAEK